jgi:hypothetical protein
MAEPVISRADDARAVFLWHGHDQWIAVLPIERPGALALMAMDPDRDTVALDLPNSVWAGLRDALIAADLGPADGGSGG